MQVWKSSGRLRISFGKRATTINEFETGAHISFEDGEVVRADLVIGADGIHSFTRSQLLLSPKDPLPKATYSGVTTIYGLVPTSLIPSDLLEPLETHQSIRTISPHAGLFSVSYASHDRSLIHWFSSRSHLLTSTWTPDTEQVRVSLLETYASFPSPIPQLIRATEKIYYWPVYRLAPIPPKWFSQSHGRIVLVGDAAHAMPPHAAQGVGMGVEDALLVANIIRALYDESNLSEASWKVPPSAALWAREYQSRRIARVEHFTAHAESQGQARSDNGYVIGRLREWGMWAAFPLINYFFGGGNPLAARVGQLFGDVQGWGYNPDNEAISLEGV